MEANTSSEHTRIRLPEGIYVLSRNATDEDDSFADLDVRADIAIVGAGADRSIVDANASNNSGIEVHDFAHRNARGHATDFGERIS